MAELYGADGAPVPLGRRLAAGGEGAVYEVHGRVGVCAKIYHAGTRTAERRAKLEAMLARVPADPTAAEGHRSIAWPRELLFGGRGPAAPLAGFIMPRLPEDARTALEYLQPEDRMRLHPGWGFRHLLTAARNLAAAVAALHHAGTCIGDLNESNVMVSETARVTLIDCDSFQVPLAAGGLARCPVGRQEYTAPELVGRSLAETDRTPRSDTFALAVLIFQLLMQGYHPFNGRWLRAGEPPDIGRRIRAGMYAYGGGRDLAPPPAAPPLAVLPRAARTALDRTFGPGIGRPEERPDARQWVAVLQASLGELVPCRRYPDRHVHPRQTRTCPWCVLAQRGADYFPEVIGAQISLPPAGVGPATPVDPAAAHLGTVPAARSTAARPGAAARAGNPAAPSPSTAPHPGAGIAAGGSAAANAAAARHPATTPHGGPAAAAPPPAHPLAPGGPRQASAPPGPAPTTPAAAAAPGPAAPGAPGTPRLVLEPAQVVLAGVVAHAGPRAATIMVRNVGKAPFVGRAEMTPGSPALRVIPDRLQISPFYGENEARLQVLVDPRHLGPTWGRSVVRSLRLIDPEGVRATALISVTAAPPTAPDAAARWSARVGAWGAALLAAELCARAAKRATPGAVRTLHWLHGGVLAADGPLHAMGAWLWLAGIVACLGASGVWRLRRGRLAWSTLWSDARWRPAAAWGAAALALWPFVAGLLLTAFLRHPSERGMQWALGVAFVPSAALVARALGAVAARPLRAFLLRRGAGPLASLAVVAAVALGGTAAAAGVAALLRALPAGAVAALRSLPSPGALLSAWRRL